MHKNNHWSDTKKVEVVTTYLALGKLPLVEAVTTVPKATIRQWKMQPWWQELVHEITQENDFELDTKLAKIVDKSLDVVVDRLEKGEFILNSKTGEVIRIPVKLKDVHRVSVDLIDKRDLIRNRQRVHVDKEIIEDHLKKLAVTFTQFVSKQLQNKTHEGEVLDAVYEERTPGLQTGVSEVSREAGTDQKAR